jgi:hypothetical protein
MLGAELPAHLPAVCIRKVDIQEDDIRTGLEGREDARGTGGRLDDLEVTQQTTDERALATERQVHPAISFGGGIRAMFGRTGGIRFEVRDISYIGVLQSTQLELKNNLAIIAGASIFFGRRGE